MDELLDFFVEHGLKAVLFWLVGAVTVFLVFGVFNLNVLGEFPDVDTKKWQAVFLDNGHVYFGKLEEYDQNFVVLRNVYYLRSASDVTDEGSENLNLIKLGGEVHGPDDEMFIRKSAILYFENLKDTSRVVESITGAAQ